MDIDFELDGESFRWNADKAVKNLAKHGVSFEQAAVAFFDPWFQTIDASSNDEAREALIGVDALHRLLYVVHIEIEGNHIRIISARIATAQERKLYGNF